MLRIRREQLEIFENDMRRRIKRTVLKDLQAERPEEFRKLGEERLRELVERAEDHIDRYAGYLESDLHRYVLLMLDFGENFQTDEAWAAEVFDDSDIPAESKMDVLEVYAADRLALKRLE